jgi:hypothetical protein
VLEAPAPLRIVFARPVGFLADVRLTIRIDSVVVHDGSFLSGVDVTRPVTLGAHRLDTCIDLGIARRRRQYAIQVPAGAGLTVELVYSRLWGNFKRALRVGHAPAPASR